MNQILAQVRELIAAGWTQQEMAVDQYGCSVHVDDPDACRFCFSGAIARVTGAVRRDEAARALGFPDTIEMVDWNDVDGRTQDEVLARIDQRLS